jgi:hypothetical protein
LVSSSANEAGYEVATKALNGSNEDDAIIASEGGGL